MTIHTASSGEAPPAAATSPEEAGTLLSIPAPDVAPAPVPTAPGGKPVPSAFATRLARIAEEQHDRFHLMDDGDPQLCKQIRKYWTEIGLDFESCVSVPWAPVFVSWCVKQAGATPAEFGFASAHSAFVRRAIQNQLKGTGVFRGRRITEHAPGVGDIIQANRAGGTHDYDFASQNVEYASRAVIVVEVGSDAAGRYALTIGGNEGDSIRRTVVRLTADGLIEQRTNNPFICVIQNLKQ